jgi:hypothetical protein
MKIRFAILCVIGVSAGSATAQDFGGTYINSGMSQAATNSIMESISAGRKGRAAECIANSSFKSLRCPENSPANSVAGVATGAGQVSLSFPYSAKRRQENIRGFVQKTQRSDPAGAAKMAQLFASTDVIGQIGAEMSSYGLRTDNVADAYAVYWINAWEAAHGIVGKAETRSRAQAVKAQAERAMSGSPEMVRATDAQKQEFAEALLVQAAMISAHMAHAAGNPAQLAAVAKAVRQGAKASGLDLDAMVLTDQGFRPARGT